MNKHTIGSVFGASLFFLLGTGSAFAVTLQETIQAAEAQFGGEAFDSETSGNISEVDVLSGGTIFEARYNATTGAFIGSDVYTNPRKVERVAAALDTATLTLLEAIAAAESAVGPGDLLEADLLISRRAAGLVFVIDIRTPEGELDVVVSSADGRILRVIPD